MKSKEALQDLRFYTSLSQGACPYSECNELCDLIERDLEVLEIIKNKLVFPLALMSLPYELYNQSVMKEQQLTQEEYDKIKEWLRDDK